MSNDKYSNNDHKPVGYYPKVKMTAAEREAHEKIRLQDERRHPPKAPKKKLNPRMAVMAVCAVVFCVSAALLIQYYSNINRAKKATSDLREIYEQAAAAQTETPAASASPTATPEPAPQSTEDEEALAVEDATQNVHLLATAEPVTIFADLWPSHYENNTDLRIADSFQKLRQQNRDIVGWLTIDGVLDEPVLQQDNAFYLTHDSTGAENVTGALFLDENCNLRSLTPNLLIHGHNMKEGAMFGSLKKYKVKDADFYKAHPYITFNTLYEEAKYVIFAVAEVNIHSNEHYYVPFWLYLDFNTEDSFNTYINKLKEFSHFQTQVDVQPGDRLLTLATCSGTDTATRLLVVARKFRDGEDTIALNQGILSTKVK